MFGASGSGNSRFMHFISSSDVLQDITHFTAGCP